jgi:N utilization substance protein A
MSHDPAVDPIGACVGPKGGRVANIVEELKGEKVDIVIWSEDLEKNVAAALAPAEVYSATLLDEREKLPRSRTRFAIISCHRQGGQKRAACR